MRRKKAYCPASLSLIFKFCPNNDILKSGSIGVGATLNKGVIASVSKIKKTHIYFNNHKINLPTIDYVINCLTSQKLKITLESPLPLGCGFGLSGASSLACALAINDYFDLNKSQKELINICHQAEIINKTGLGTVATCATGGFLIKTSAGLPVSAIPLPFIGEKIYFKYISILPTDKILTNSAKVNIINQAADVAMTKLLSFKKITLADILDITYDYDLASHLLKHPQVAKIIKKIKKNKGHAALATLGNVIITDKKPNYLTTINFQQLEIVKDKVRLL